jgi:transposase
MRDCVKRLPTHSECYSRKEFGKRKEVKLMGNRITRAASHLPADEVQRRIQEEERLWRRQRWEIIYQALTAPRQAEDIAKTVGVSVATVHRVISTYKQGGVAAIETPGKGGRRHQYLTLEQERTLLQPFLVRAARGEMTTAEEIKPAFEAQIGHVVNKSTLYRLLARHGLQHLGAASNLAQGQVNQPGPKDAGLVRERREQQSSRRFVSRGQAPRRYPSDLSDQEWAILEALIPPAKPGGRPRSVDMREVLNALLYVDRTGCQWRALPLDFPPWSTVWTYFRTWRTDGTWQRIHQSLREQVRVKQGREATPSAAIIDSQSVKTSQKGGGAAMTEAKRSKAASGTSSSTRMD